MLARARAGCLAGVEARGVDVEVHLGGGLPGFDLVGLPETAVREARVRVRAALAQSGFSLPPRRVVLNLAPADLRKGGGALDLAIAVALLAAAGRCAPNRLEDTLLFGELSLSGALRPSRGLLPQLRHARERGLRRAVVPRAQLAEASWVQGLDVGGADDLVSVVGFLDGRVELARPEGAPEPSQGAGGPDLLDVHGQAAAKRALAIAAAGGHHVLLVGPPGAGKTMLARRLPGILPPPTPEEALDIATIRSAAGLSPEAGPHGRPFRAPHHTASATALIGGGDPIRPGEVTLAHRGVLFLDELPEFSRRAIEAFRAVLESGRAVVARARQRVEMPAAPLVVAAMNPCPCGYHGTDPMRCRCSPGRVEGYRGRVSGPILDRFDLHVALPAVDLAELTSPSTAEAEGASSAAVRTRATEARARLAGGAPGSRGGRARDGLRDRVLDLPSDARRVLADGGAHLGLSLRGAASAVRVARTVAALEGRDRPSAADVAEALGYRLLEGEDDEARTGGR
ncbi:MAG: YifB family Mg chelatase-like AAA ATPase [Sandaracinaceae bacterium]